MGDRIGSSAVPRASHRLISVLESCSRLQPRPGGLGCWRSPPMASTGWTQGLGAREGHGGRRAPGVLKGGQALGAQARGTRAPEVAGGWWAKRVQGPSVHVRGAAARQEDPLGSPSGSTRPSGSHGPAPGEEGLSRATAWRPALGMSWAVAQAPPPAKGLPWALCPPRASVSSPMAQAGYPFHGAAAEGGHGGPEREDGGPQATLRDCCKKYHILGPLGTQAASPPCHPMSLL